MNIRKAHEHEMDEIYMMGFDTWSDSSSKKAYLESCFNSPKYHKGCWWVLENESGNIVSSLIIYQFNPLIFGIGSIATSPRFRNKGYASILIEKVCNSLEERKSKAIYLYSDINSAFYEKHKFKKIEEKYQKHDSSICMIRSSTSQENMFVPSYF